MAEAETPPWAWPQGPTGHLPIPKTSVASESNIAIAGSAADGKATYELAVPRKHVLEIMMVIMQMQQQKAQQSSS